jgi:hypothetical protein
MSFSTIREWPMDHVYTETKQIYFNSQKGWNMSRKLTRVEMDFPMTTQEPVEQVNATDMVIMTVPTMRQKTFCPTLTIVEVPLEVPV